MKILLVFVYVTCVLGHTSGRLLIKEKIVGGTIASPGQFPHQISERYNGNHICGGSILDKNTILTAAHCVNQFPSRNVTIVAGTNKLNQDGVVYSASRHIIHEKWNSITSRNDIAVIKIKTAIQFTEFIQPIAIDSTLISAGVKCVLSGWGITSYPGDVPSNNLLYFEGRIVDLKKCKRIFSGSNYPVLNSNICAFSKYGVGACVGDSGGPLISNQKQIGVASWVSPCGVGAPDVYTRVSYYSDWIKKQQAENN